MLIKILSLIVLITSSSLIAQTEADSLYNIAKQYDESEKYDLAIEYYTKTINSDPKYYNAHFNKAMVLAQLNRFDLAIENLEHCLKLNENDAEAYYYLGICYYSIGNLSAGIGYLNDAIKLKSNFSDAIILRGNIYYKQRKYQLAIDDFIQSIAIIENFDIYYSIASCYEKLGLLSEALEIYTFISDKEVNNKDAIYNNIGNILNAQGDYIQALSYFKNAISLEKDVPLYYYNLGVSYYHIEEINLAFDNWCKAKKMGYDEFDESVKLAIVNSGFSSKFTNCD